MTDAAKSNDLVYKKSVLVCALHIDNRVRSAIYQLFHSLEDLERENRVKEEAQKHSPQVRAGFPMGNHWQIVEIRLCCHCCQMLGSKDNMENGFFCVRKKPSWLQSLRRSKPSYDIVDEVNRSKHAYMDQGSNEKNDCCPGTGAGSLVTNTGNIRYEDLNVTH